VGKAWSAVVFIQYAGVCIEGMLTRRFRVILSRIDLVPNGIVDAGFLAWGKAKSSAELISVLVPIKLRARQGRHKAPLFSFV